MVISVVWVDDCVKYLPLPLSIEITASLTYDACRESTTYTFVVDCGGEERGARRAISDILWTTIWTLLLPTFGRRTSPDIILVHSYHIVERHLLFKAFHF